MTILLLVKCVGVLSACVQRMDVCSVSTGAIKEKQNVYDLLLLSLLRCYI